ncbi:hypothetical protein [Candidatus Poriferisodalis sp.]|uniref:hypothetical protein n=1 Tax=Candidatus Poriferisodalis sp. TaxID=3101277 RepID=UPI003B525750
MRCRLGSRRRVGGVTLVVANGWSPPDIGAAAALAARSGRSAVIYTLPHRLQVPMRSRRSFRTGRSWPEASAALLRDYQVARVILIGGTAAISQSTQDMIAAVTHASVSRLTGADRVHTAARAARRMWRDETARQHTHTLAA